MIKLVCVRIGYEKLSTPFLAMIPLAFIGHNNHIVRKKTLLRPTGCANQ